jgi:hypothetical protein
MLVRRLAFIIGVLCLLLWTAPIVASGADWSAWLYDSESGHLALVAADGVVIRDLYVPLSQGFNQLPGTVAFSHDGSLLAFVAANTDTGEHQLVVFDTDVQLQKLLVSLPNLLADSISAGGSERAFNDNDTLLAFGFAADDGWRIDVYDLASGAVAYTLFEEATAVYEVIGDEGQPLLPVIQQFEGTQVTFSLAIIGAAGQSRCSSFVWDFLTGGLVPAPEFFQLDTDILASSGELIMPVGDPELPNHAAEFAAGGQRNALYAFDPTAGATFPFYNDPERDLFWPRFVQNGERIFAGGFAAGAESPDLFLIERDGTVASAVSVPGITSVRGLTDGLIYGLERPEEQGSMTSLMHVNTRNGETLEAGTPVWTSAPNTAYAIVWAKDQRQAETAEFMAWAQLAEPVVVGE